MKKVKGFEVIKSENIAFDWGVRGLYQVVQDGSAVVGGGGGWESQDKSLGEKRDYIKLKPSLSLQLGLNSTDTFPFC